MTRNLLKENNLALKVEIDDVKELPETALTSLKSSTTATDTNQAKAASSVPQATTSIRSQTFIIQKYIERPFLVNQRKFDIRVWVCLTQDLDVYFFKEGYLRTSSQPYSLTQASLEDDYVHLTNNAI